MLSPSSSIKYEFLSNFKKNRQIKHRRWWRGSHLLTGDVRFGSGFRNPVTGGVQESLAPRLPV